MRIYLDFFLRKGFKVDLKQADTDHYDFKATRKGSNFVLMRYTDFYFVKLSNNYLKLDDLKEYHITSKKFANKAYKIPKALRLNVPNINSVILANDGIDSEAISYVQEHKNSLVGGEQESLFIIDLKTNALYCAGPEKSHISGEARLVWGKSKEFKDINGKNRAYYLMQHFAETI